MKCDKYIKNWTWYSKINLNKINQPISQLGWALPGSSQWLYLHSSSPASRQEPSLSSHWFSAHFPSHFSSNQTHFPWQLLKFGFPVQLIILVQDVFPSANVLKHWPSGHPDWISKLVNIYKIILIMIMIIMIMKW